MWTYVKRLEMPIRIKNRDLRMAQALLAQYGGPDSELSAAIRYLTQRYSMPTGKAKGLLTDIGTEEMAHWEMLGTMIHQLMEGATIQEIKAAGLEGYYTMHDHAVYPCAPSGEPWLAAYIQATGDPITDLHEDMAAEQKARTTYEHLIKLTDDPDVRDPLKFLWAREVVHYQRFGEALMDVQDFKTHKTVF